VKIDFDLPACTEELLFATVADDGLPVRHRAGFGGRGSTKSHSFARRLLLRGFEKPERILAAREIQRSIDGSVKKLLDDLIPRMGFGPLNGDGFYASQKYEITARNGTSVNFAGLRASPLPTSTRRERSARTASGS
jgi:phage terminase large subunit